MLLLYWVASTSSLSLLSKLSLGNGFVDLLIVVTTWVGVLARWVHALEHLIVVLSGVEELLGCHHHLLVVILASIWSFPLVDQVKKMSLIILCDSISSTDSVASNTTWVNAEGACIISITCLSNVLLIYLFKWLSSLMLLSIEIVHILLPSIALSDILHEVSIVHGISHLCLILTTTTTFIGSLWSTKSSNSGLVEHLLLLILSIYMWEHLVNSWIICWLEENTMMGGIHLIDA